MRTPLFVIIAIVSIAAPASKAEQVFEGSATGFLVKAEVDMSGLQAPMDKVPEAVVFAFATVGAAGPPVITSASEYYSWRASSSLHLQGLALDVRGRDLPLSTLELISENLRLQLGSDFDVVLENFGEYNPYTHINIEYDPAVYTLTAK